LNIGKHEAIECPAEFQDYLKDIFGVNHFGDALVRIIWGQTETWICLSAAGGYEERYIGHGQPCWIIQRWRAPEIFGTPEAYFQLMGDPETGCGLIGEYPQFGMYETVTPLMHREYNTRTQELEIRTVPLDWELIEKAIPLLEQAEAMSEAERQEALAAAERAENARIVQQIADRLYDELPSFYGPTSHAQIASRTALITRKMVEVEKKWKQMGPRRRRQPMRGMFQR
jgi:hypothetical protein